MPLARTYRQLDLDERRTLFRLVEARTPVGEIAARLGRHPSTGNSAGTVSETATAASAATSRWTPGTWPADAGSGAASWPPTMTCGSTWSSA